MGCLAKEILIINDASSDDTKGAIQRYQKQYPDFPITYFEHDENQGKGAALHTGIKLARGQ